MFRLFLFWFWFYISLNFYCKTRQWAKLDFCFCGKSSVKRIFGLNQKQNQRWQTGFGWRVWLACLCANPHRIVSLPCLAFCLSLCLPVSWLCTTFFPHCLSSRFIPQPTCHSVSSLCLHIYHLSFIIDLYIYTYIYSSFFEQRFWSDTSYSINPLITYPAICLY